MTPSQNGEQRAVIRATSASSITEFFNPDQPQTRHFTFVVSSNPAFFIVYVDCIEFGRVSLVGDSTSPDPGLDVFIGKGQPHPLRGGRLGGQLHGLYYHTTALTESQITDFCSCGFEALILPPLPASIVADVANQHMITLQAASGSIPNADAITVLRSINYTNQFDSPTVDPNDPTRTLDFTITEENGNMGSRRGSIRLVNTDDTFPVVDINGFAPGIGNSVVYEENGDPVLVSPDIRISREIDGFINPTFNRVTVELTNPIDEGEVLSAVASNVIAVVVSDNRQRLDIVGPGIPREFEAVLQTVRYANLNDNPNVNTERRVSFTAFDTEGRTNSEQAISIITLTSLNDPPQLSLAATTGSLISVVRFEEGSSGVQVAPNITVMDVDNTDLMRAEVTLTSTALDSDNLLIGTFAGIDSEYNSVTGILTLSGQAPLSQYQSALSSVVFLSTDSPFLDVSVESLTRTVTIQVFDGQLNSERVTVQVQFMPNNDAPNIILPNPLVTFRDGDEMILIAPSADITDSDNRQLQNMTIRLLEGNLDSNTLSSGNQVSAVLVFNDRSIAEFVSILRSILYINQEPEPSLLQRTINITVCDFMLCTTAAVTVNIEDVNDNPPIFSRTEYSFSVSEDRPVGFTVGTLDVTDADIQITTLTFTTTESFFDLVSEGSSVRILTTAPLDAENIDFYFFNVSASDGVNVGVTEITINILNVNEPPTLLFTPANPSLVVGAASQSRLIQAQLQISDQDFNDSIPTALLTLRNVPQGSNEVLMWEPVPDYVFGEISANVYELSGPGDPETLGDALRGVLYVAGEVVSEPTTIRTVAITITDVSGASSIEAVVTISLASIPQFSQQLYLVSLTEETVVNDFLRVNASVESGGDTIEYAVEGGRGVAINNSTGQLSLLEAVDREENSFLAFSVFAIDSLPPARTGTATVNVTVLDLDDVRPSVDNLSNITVSTNVTVTLLPTVQVTDPDTIGSILVTRLSVFGVEALRPLPFSARVCVDEPNVVDKMISVCGGLDSLVLLEQNLDGDFSLTSDEHGNNLLTLTDSGYAIVNGDFSQFYGGIDAFTFALWVRVESSGYIAYFGSPDSIERYFALYYSQSKNQLIVTLKREGVSGLGGQIRISFQLTSTDLSDGNYHFVMLQYSVTSTIVCVVDGQLTDSVAVVYKEPSFIAQVFSK